MTFKKKSKARVNSLISDYIDCHDVPKEGAYWYHKAICDCFLQVYSLETKKPIDTDLIDLLHDATGDICGRVGVYKTKTNAEHQQNIERVFNEFQRIFTAMMDGVVVIPDWRKQR